MPSAPIRPGNYCTSLDAACQAFWKPSRSFNTPCSREETSAAGKRMKYEAQSKSWFRRSKLSDFVCATSPVHRRPRVLRVAYQRIYASTCPPGYSGEHPSPTRNDRDGARPSSSRQQWLPKSKYRSFGLDRSYRTAEMQCSSTPTYDNASAGDSGRWPRGRNSDIKQ